MKTVITLLICLAALGCSTKLDDGFWIMEDSSCPIETHVNVCHKIEDNITCSCVWRENAA